MWVGAGRSKGRGKEGASQQFQGSETASQGRQMGEQVLYLPSSNSAEQSCHQALKGVIKAAAKPSSGQSLGSSCLHQSQQIDWPRLLVGTTGSDDGALHIPAGKALATRLI